MNLFPVEYFSGVEFFPLGVCCVAERLLENVLIELDGDGSLLASLEINGNVSGDPVKPGVKAGRRAKIFELLVNLDEDLLRYVEGILLVVGDTIGYGVNPLLVFLYQLLKGVGVALACLLNKLKV